MPDSRTQPYTLLDIASAFWVYRARFVLATLLVLVCTTAVVVLLPKRYESEAKLFVRLGRNSASIDPVMIGNAISLQESRETEMNSIVDMLTSRGLADRVVAEVGAERILKKYAWLDLQLEKLSSLISFGDKESAVGATSREGISRAEEMAAAEILKNLDVASPKRSTSIGLVYLARDPQLAFEVASSVINNYQNMHVTATKSDGSVKFFQEQFTAQQELLNAAEKKFRDVKNEAEMLTLQGKQSSLQSEADSIKQLKIQTQADLSAAESRMADIEASMSKLPESLASEKISGIELAATDSMRDRLYALEIAEKSLAAQLQDDHPELKKIRKQLADAKAIMEKQPTDRVHSVVGVNPIWVEMQKEFWVAKANVASLKTKLSELSELDNKMTVRINALNAVEIEAEDLQRQISIAKENHANYARKLEESRIKAEMDSNSLSNVSVVTPPTVRWKHSAPNRPLLAILGGFFALACGGFVALVSDLRRRYAASSVPATSRTSQAAGSLVFTNSESGFSSGQAVEGSVGRTAIPR
jgi:polysaccharide biosynthesis protein PslE